MTRMIAAWIVAVSAMGCEDAPDSVAPDAGTGGTPSIVGTPVASFETSSCSTATVLGLSRQIAEEVDCVIPGQLVLFEERPGLEFTGAAVLPYLAEGARTQLYAAAAAGNGRVMRVTSGFRTVVQQYLLRRWFELGRCGIPAAAEPGRSNHESGRAVDLSNYAEWTATLSPHGWTRNVPNDPVHFEHLETPDMRGADVLAFQRLWNRNAPDDPIDEDGSFGPATEDRVKRAPAEGFGIGAICGSTRVATETASIDREASAVAGDGPGVVCAH